jgi:hypothetical protein
MLDTAVLAKKPMIAGFRAGRPNQLQTRTPAFSPPINGASNVRLCDNARRNELKGIRSRFPASIKGDAGDALEVLPCCDVRACAGGDNRGDAGRECS